MKQLTVLCTILLLSALPLAGQTSVEQQKTLWRYAYAARRFGQMYPQEKAYLHFDNTGYYQGDNIWFQCYVVNAGQNRPQPFSRTLYVELLNPGGEIIAKQTLPIRDGRCHGNFTLNQLPFYAGFYEVRAYTKYMLDFGEEAIFSRILPVFEKPETPGDFTQKEIRPYAVYRYPRVRKQAQKQKKLNLKFYPEGGYAVNGLPCHMAFEATDAYGNPVDVNGQIIHAEKQPLVDFASLHEGRGAFTYTPQADEPCKAVVEWQGRIYRFDLPEARPTGIVWNLDNVRRPDSLHIRVMRHPDMPADVLGIALLCRGQLHGFYLVETEGDRPVEFNADLQGFPAGVAQAVLFGTDGRIIADRLFFAGRPDTVSLSAKMDKLSYQPYDSIRIALRVHDAQGRPVRAPLSVSVRDANDEIVRRHSLLTDLLLMSEIKGYVHRPAWYFEADDSLHRRALDQLLMVQGWRRYDWEQMTGVSPFAPKYLPEQGIEVHGTVVSMARSKPQADVTISTALMKRDTTETDSTQMAVSLLSTDSLGRFAFRTDVEGRWNLVLAVTKNGKKKDHRILLDRVFSPSPRPYPLAEMQLELRDDETAKEDRAAADTLQPDFTAEALDSLLNAYEDSLKQAGIHEKVHRLDEVVVTAKKRTRARDIYNARRKSMAYYDVGAEIDDILDRNKFIGDDIHQLLLNMNPAFSLIPTNNGMDSLRYHNRGVLFVINYKRTNNTEMERNKYRLLALESIRAIYITEDLSTMVQYADPMHSPLEIDKKYGCAVLIETYPEGAIPARAAKGVRKTRLEGYSRVKEFYQPDYRILPHDEDFRRTLYWNPAVRPDADGRATLRFYNNSRCIRPRVTVETLTDNGAIGVLEQ